MTVVAVGDIACGSRTPASFACRHAETAALVDSLRPDLVLALGDAQYEEGALDDFERFYGATWGAFRDITYPVAGNHEYESAGASGYFDYFNGVGSDSGRAGHRARGWYAFDAGAWLLVALNSNCAHVGGCGHGSPQERALRAMLARSDAPCILAFWHHPRFSSAGLSDSTLAPLWRALEEYGADLILAGHHHIYERLAPLTSTGVPDDGFGIRSFVVGTGGKDVYGTGRSVRGSEVRHGRSFGVLRLILRTGSFDWEFHAVPGPGPRFTDAGSANCR